MTELSTESLGSLSTEVDESQIKIVLTSQCIKAQAYVIETLHKQALHQKEVGRSINSDNLKLENEIRNAEQEIKSLMIARETIKSSNTELKKELLLVQGKKIELTERIKIGEKKYEELWLRSKARYESLPYIQNLLQYKHKKELLESNIDSLNDDIEAIKTQIKTKTEDIMMTDRKNIIKLAEFLCYDRPKHIKLVKDKIKEIAEITKGKEEATNANFRNKTDDNPKIFTQQESNRKSVINETNNYQYGTPTFPDLQIGKIDLEGLRMKLDQIKVQIDKSTQNKETIKVNEDNTKKNNIIDDRSIYFNNITEKTSEDNGNKRKLIEILEDVQIDKDFAYNIMTNVDKKKFQEVNIISNETNKRVKKPTMEAQLDNNDKEEYQEIIVAATSSQNILQPPTQYLDLTQGNEFNNNTQHVEVIVHATNDIEEVPINAALAQFKNSQDIFNRKKVSFNLPTIEEVVDEVVTEKEEQNKEQATASQLEISATSDEHYTRIKDMILKKHNLDLSPQFIYPKNNTLQRTIDNGVTSKFFNENDIKSSGNIQIKEIQSDGKVEVQPQRPDDTNKITGEDELIEEEESSPKTTQGFSLRTATDYLFNRGNVGIMDSPAESMNTTVMEDSDFPMCIDSSVLLSPKSDMPMAISDNNVEVTSQEIPNFLSGLRKTGLSFFKQITADPKPESSTQNSENNFNFNFGSGDEKKRGGLFNMFR